jgi:hypothetical protein
MNALDDDLPAERGVRAGEGNHPMSGCLTAHGRRLEQLRRSDPLVADILDEVERNLRGRRFERVQTRAKDFLTYMVDSPDRTDRRAKVGS